MKNSLNRVKLQFVLVLILLMILFKCVGCKKDLNCGRIISLTKTLQYQIDNRTIYYNYYKTTIGDMIISRIDRQEVLEEGTEVCK